MAAGERAVGAAEELGDPGLLVRALVVQADGLRMLGDSAAALAGYTRVLALADDPKTGHRLGGEPAARAVARAYLGWVECARFLTGIGVRELFGVLDAADRWLAVTGRRGWRAGVLLQRAAVHRRLGEREALAAHNPGAPGYTLGTYRFQLGDLLRASTAN